MRLVLQSLLLASLALAAEPAATTNGESNFKTAGFPTLTIVCGVGFMLWAILAGRNIGGGDLSTTEGRVFGLVNVINTGTAVFYSFGPGNLGGNPNASVLSILLMFLVSLGYFVCFTNHAKATLVWFGFAVYIELAILGMLPLMNFGADFTDYTQSGCAQYFKKGDLDRCSDEGYIQLLRVWSAFTVFGTAAAIVITFPKLDWAMFSAAPAHPGNRPSYQAREGQAAVYTAVPDASKGGQTLAQQAGLLSAGFQSEGPIPNQPYNAM